MFSTFSPFFSEIVQSVVMAVEGIRHLQTGDCCIGFSGVVFFSPLSSVLEFCSEKVASLAREPVFLRTSFINIYALRSANSAAYNKWGQTGKIPSFRLFCCALMALRAISTSASKHLRSKSNYY